MDPTVLFKKKNTIPNDSIEAICNFIVRGFVYIICICLSNALILQDPEEKVIGQEDYLQEWQAASNWD